MSLTKVSYSMIQGAPVNALDLGADPTGALDSWAVLQAAIIFCEDQGVNSPWTPTYSGSNVGTLRIPAGCYKLSAPLVITHPINIIGDGVQKTQFNFTTSDSTNFAFIVGDNDANVNSIGGQLAGFSVLCNAGTVASGGLHVLSSNPGTSAITGLWVHDVDILNPSVGFKLTGTVYQNVFERMAIRGNGGISGTNGVNEYGILTNNTGDMIYNHFRDIQVTDVKTNAWAIYASSAFSQFDNIQTDGIVRISSVGGRVNGLTIEVITATTIPAAALGYAIFLDQVQIVTSLALRDVPQSKVSTAGVFVQGNTIINGVYFQSSSAGMQPDKPFVFGTNACVLSNVQMTSCVTKLGLSDLANVTAFRCSDITDAGNDQTYGTWTPDYATWTTPPTTITARYVKSGNRIDVNLYCQGGVCNAGSTINGLPFANSGTSGGVATAKDGNDSTKGFTGMVFAGASALVSIPATNFGTDYWTMMITYFTA